jgi:ribonuclease VapC
LTLFVDASAIVAMLADEPEKRELAMRINDDLDPLWSAMSSWEAISSLCSSYKMPFAAARDQVEQMAAVMPFRLVPIGDAERLQALDAYQRYGKRSGHRARLNMGDCFAYACARTNGAKLLYKGEDFVHTDMA